MACQRSRDVVRSSNGHRTGTVPPMYRTVASVALRGGRTGNVGARYGCERSEAVLSLQRGVPVTHHNCCAREYEPLASRQLHGEEIIA